jgi:hypothetical protein
LSEVFMKSYARTIFTLLLAGSLATVTGCSKSSNGTGENPPNGSGGAGGSRATGGQPSGSGGTAQSGGTTGSSSGDATGSGGSGPTGTGGAQVDAADTGVSDPDDPPDAAPSGDAPSAEVSIPSGPDLPGCTLQWGPSPKRDGEGAFELFEMPDVQLPGGSGPTHGGVKHITVVPDRDAYRIDSHYRAGGPSDFDRVTLTGPTRTDRLRCETRGMRAPDGKIIDMLNNETWRMTWSFYVPSSLKGTSRFTHIMQLKYVDKGGGVSGSPIITLTLRPNDRMELLLWLGGGSVSIVDAANLHDKWLTADLTMKVAPQGSLRWVLKDGDKVVVDKQQAGVIWPSDAARLRPKWGIYRGVTDGVGDTYMLLENMRAYKCQ